MPMPLDYTLLNNPANAPQINNLIMERQANQAALGKAQLENESSKNGYAAMVLATAGLSGNPNLYLTAKKHLEGMGVDTSVYSDDPAVGSKQAQLSRMYGATPTAILSAMMQQQQMAQRGGLAVGDPTSYGWTPGGMTPPAMPSPQTPQPAAPGASRQVVQVTPAETPPTGAIAGALTNGVPQGDMEAARGMVPNLNVGQAPARRPNETVEAYNSRLNAWKAENEINPELQANIAAQKSGGETKAKDAAEQLSEGKATLRVAMDNLPLAFRRFNEMRKLSDQSNYGFGTNDEGTGLIQKASQQMDSQGAVADTKLHTFESQGILPEIGVALKAAGAGTKGNQFLEKIISRAAGLNLSDSPSAKKAAIDELRKNYIANVVSANQQVADMGGPALGPDELKAKILAAGGTQEDLDLIDTANSTYSAQPSASAPPAQDGQPVRVNNPAEAMKLPSGAVFMTPDGRLKVRP